MQSHNNYTATTQTPGSKTSQCRQRTTRAGCRGWAWGVAWSDCNSPVCITMNGRWGEMGRESVGGWWLLKCEIFKYLEYNDIRATVIVREGERGGQWENASEAALCERGETVRAISPPGQITPPLSHQTYWGPGASQPAQHWTAQPPLTALLSLTLLLTPGLAWRS